MLTEKQLDELKPFIEHERFGKILKKAIESWIISTPITNFYGIRLVSDITLGLKYDFGEIHGNKTCCLAGASLTGLNVVGASAFEDFLNYYKLTPQEAQELIVGFDHVCITKDKRNFYDSSAYKFGFNVGLIVLRNDVYFVG